MRCPRDWRTYRSFRSCLPSWRAAAGATRTWPSWRAATCCGLWPGPNRPQRSCASSTWPPVPRSPRSMHRRQRTEPCPAPAGLRCPFRPPGAGQRRQRPPRGRAKRARAGCENVRGARACSDGSGHGALHGSGFRAQAKRGSQQQRGAEDRSVGVGDSLARDVGRRAVDRLVEPARSRRPRRPTAASPAIRPASRPRRSGCRRTCSRSQRRRNRRGRRIRCIAAESTSMCSSVRSANSLRTIAFRDLAPQA